MNIDKLLNPELEHEIINANVTDNEIFKSVHECWQGEEMMEINGGDDDEIINILSPQDALVASLILQWYVADLNDPCACKLEAILVSSAKSHTLQ